MIVDRRWGSRLSGVEMTHMQGEIGDVFIFPGFFPKRKAIILNIGNVRGRLPQIHAMVLPDDPDGCDASIETFDDRFFFQEGLRIS